MQLRPYQLDGAEEIQRAWANGVNNALYVLPCGGGKTVIFSELLKIHNAASCAVAHRQELVGQISLALARDGVQHRIIGPNNVVKLAVQGHMEEVGASYYNPNAKCAVAGVDTLIRRGSQLKNWLPTVTKWVMDEAHHVLEKNKWGKAVKMFPNALGLGVTATPERADGKGLGRHADGLFDTMIEGPTMREIIDMGYLTDYRIFAPPSDVDYSSLTKGASGDYSLASLTAAVHKSNMFVGDIVEQYLKHAKGKLGITFVPDVETAHSVAAGFNAHGIPAAALHAGTPATQRASLMRKFKNRELLQLVNVDLFGEGFDLPSIEVVSMGRKTESFGLYVQQFGRGCRLMEGKLRALIIDHVGNVVRHGLPDAKRLWTLDAREKRTKSAPDDVVPLKACPSCTAVYERTHAVCPFCGHKPVVMPNDGPEMVDGDLLEIDPHMLAKMRGDIDYADRGVDVIREEMRGKYASQVAINTACKHQEKRIEMQQALRASIAWWAGHQKSLGRSDSESHRRFYYMFGVDIMTAQTLKRADALILANKINMFLGGL